MKYLMMVIMALLLLAACAQSVQQTCKMDSDCQSGDKCYASYFAPEGAQPEQRGDLLCHKLCSTNAECKPPFVTCKNVEIWTGSVVEDSRMCV